MKKIFFTLISLTFIALSTTYAQVGIGTNTPNASSILELQSSEKGLLPPRMATRPSNAPEGLTIYNTSIKCLEIFDGTAWQNLCDGSEVGATIATGPCQGQPAFFTFEGLLYKPVESIIGKCWLDRNLGASQVATSSTDAQAYGDLYQWGRATDGHEKRNSLNYNAIISNDGVANFIASGNAWDGQFILRNSGNNNWVDPSINGVNDLWQGVNGVNNPCPSGYRLPTFPEWDSERLSWSPSNNVGAFASTLKLTLPGGRNRSTGSLFLVDMNAAYWSSTISGTSSLALGISSSSSYQVLDFRATGFSVRCLKD
jgi:uncharacterized protein (TIGR02145 family)